MTFFRWMVDRQGCQKSIQPSDRQEMFQRRNKNFREFLAQSFQSVATRHRTSLLELRRTFLRFRNRVRFRVRIRVWIRIGIVLAAAERNRWSSRSWKISLLDSTLDEETKSRKTWGEGCWCNYLLVEISLQVTNRIVLLVDMTLRTLIKL